MVDRKRGHSVAFAKVTQRPALAAIGVTAFKARCLALIDDVARGKARRVVLLKRNRPVAAIVPIGGEQEPAELWGALRGTVKIPPETDLTQPAGEPWEAET
jgi:antitoxin (DNA-binding transcriptional repressor) of toxin-antitoxin stability system